MRSLNLNEQQFISGGCDSDTCQTAALEMLNACTYPQLQELNVLFKSVVQSAELIGADAETLKNALITALANYQF
jgi:hypothetical protein